MWRGIYMQKMDSCNLKMIKIIANGRTYRGTADLLEPGVHGWAILKELHRLSNLCCYTSQDSSGRDEETEMICDWKREGKWVHLITASNWRSRYLSCVQSDSTQLWWSTFLQSVTVPDQYWHVCSKIPFCAFSFFVDTHPGHLTNTVWW